MLREYNKIAEMAIPNAEPSREMQLKCESVQMSEEYNKR